MTETRINPERNFICIESYNNYIQCLFTSFESNKYILALYDVINLEQKYLFTIEEELDISIPFLYSMNKLINDSFVIAYSLKNNLVKVLIKSLYYNETSKSLDICDYIENVPYIYLNENNSYIFEDITPNRNSLSIINENKFAIILNMFNGLKEDNYDNTQILIYIFSIFNEHKNINVRKYSINFKLYNIFNHGKILGYTLDNHFGIFMESSLQENKNITNAGFITFGFINTINNTTYEVFDNNFFEPSTLTSNAIELKKYFSNKIQNNLFGYEVYGVIILNLIDENIGFFYTGFRYKITEGQVIPIYSDIKLELYRNYTPGNYSIEFAGIVREPKFTEMEDYSEEIFNYPNSSNISEKDFYKQNLLIGKKIKYNFEIKENQAPKECYPSCATCEDYSNDDNDQKCLTCKKLFYFINGTQNCYNYVKKHYYFDEETEKYYPCYKDCYTCEKKEISAQNMNCLSCTNEFIFYNKSKNCLNCPNYINYAQTQCISSVPEGYYVLNKTLGLIEPCYHLCKTCSKGPVNINNTFYMNCDICLYENKSFIPLVHGDCPQSSSEHIDDVEPVGGKCPKEKPILKENKCKMIYCTQKEFEDKICVINNDVVKKQWLNKFNIFQDDSSNVKYDINEKGELILFSQKKEGNNINIYLYGFNKNYEGIFYDEKNKNYVSNKKIILKNKDKLIEKIKYIELNKKGYLLNFMNDVQMHLIDLESNEYYSHYLPNIPASLDKLEKYINTNNKYFYDYVNCFNDMQSKVDNCYIGLTNYLINSKSDFKIEYNKEEFIRLKPKTKLICINNIFASQYILCKYNSFELLDEQTFINNHSLTIFEINTFAINNTFVLEKYFMPDKQIIDAMIPMDENKSIFIIAYSISKNVIKILFKTLKDNNNVLEDAIEEVPEILINKDLKYYFNGDVFSNDLCKIDNNNYALLIKTHKNKDSSDDINDGLLVVTLKIYNLSKVLVRYYHLDLNLYNINLKGNVLGINFNGFLGALLEINSNDEKMGKSAFLTFGFINSVNNVSIEKGTLDLITYKRNIIISDYITEIENNIFGYEIEGVKILNIPDVYKVGGFLNLNNRSNLIKINDIISISSQLRFSPVKQPIYGNYSISFVGIVKEPSEQIAINIDDNSEYYPNNSTQYFYTTKTFEGKIFTYNFALKEDKIKCFKNCEECLYTSEDINNQYCLKCKSGFYFVYNTQNCFDKIDHGYYFDSVKKSFYPCYKDCYTCSTKEVSSTYMNCLTCSTPFKFYEKNKNCLKCDKYVNYEQTKCINTIPEGYKKKKKETGIIDKCFKLCKTCSREAIYRFGDQMHMNCDSCLYKNNSKIKIAGNCPEKEEKEEEKEKEEEDDDHNDDEKEDSSKTKGGNNFVVYLSVGLSLVIVIVIIVVIYFKCCRKNSTKVDPSNYLNIDGKGGKSIPFDDDADIGIN